MAWKRGNKEKKTAGEQTPEEELDAYKKDIGKQYMDGLISEKEYEKLLSDKTVELGLDIPEPQEDYDGPECPSCGAHVDPGDKSCPICGEKLEPAVALEAAEPPKIPEEEQNRVCPGCGALVSKSDTLCTVCGGTLPPAEYDALDAPVEETAEEPVPEEPGVAAEEAETPGEEEPEEPAMEEPEPTEEVVCPECGAYLEPGATECMICDAPIVVAAVATETVVTEVSAEEEPVPEEPPMEEPEEVVCPECGAYLEPGATECMICDAPIVAAAVVTETDVTEVPAEEESEPMEEAVPEEPVMEEPETPPEEADELACPSCGAFAESDATVCIICDTPLAAPEPEDMPTNEDIDMPPEDEEPEAEEEIVLQENEIICPSCSKVIPVDSETCPECWTDLSLYVRCTSCSLLTPAGERLCRECFAPLADIAEEEVPEFVPDEEDILKDIDIPEEVVISEELQEEMTIIETQEEQGKDCLVCGAIFGPDDQLCPICGIEYGVEIEEPVMPDTLWEVLEVEVQPTVRTCPNCGTNVTGLDATDREVEEGRWFFRGLVAIFTGIFFTSFSIWVRGVSAESASQGTNPPPTDIVMNLAGWILVSIGLVFWFLSWRLHEQRIECPECGVETDPNMEACINCGTDLGLEPEDEPPEEVEEELLPEEDGNYLDRLPKRGYASEETAAEEEEPLPEIEEVAEEPAIEEEEPLPDIEEVAEEPLPDIEEVTEEPAIEEVSEEPLPDIEEVTEEPLSDIEDAIEEPLEKGPEEPLQPEAEVTETPLEPEHFIGEELPAEHEEHKKCPGCGIFVDLNETICPVCDTEFAPEPAVEIPGEETELAGLDAEDVAPEPVVEAPDEVAADTEDVEPTMDDITLPDSSAPSMECPSCGADLEAGTKICPVCEYPLE